MTGANRKAHIADEVRKGNNALRAGTELIALGLYDDAVTRLYYAAFHFACAALLTEGVEATTHRGLHALFSEQLVRPGKITPARAKDLKRLQGFREAADYTRSFAFTHEGAEEEAAVALRFVADMRAYLEAGSWLIDG